LRNFAACSAELCGLKKSSIQLRNFYSLRNSFKAETKDVGFDKVSCSTVSLGIIFLLIF